MQEQKEAVVTGAKVISAWLGVAITSWSAQVAQTLAAIYSAILIGEWAWKRFGRSAKSNTTKPTQDDQ